MEQMLEMTKDGVRVIHEDVGEKLTKKKLSPSLITGMEGCPARWVSETFVTRDLIPQDPLSPARLGTLFHKAMEDFFSLEPAERTTERIRLIVREVLSSPEYADLKYNETAIAWLRGAVNSYYNMGADSAPEDVRIAVINHEGRQKVGLEVFVSGTLGDSSRPVLGFVDRIQELDNGALMVEDWKSGAKAKHYRHDVKKEEGWPEQRQQLIYTLLLEQSGQEVDAARLIYPVAEDVVNVPVKNEEYREKVIADIERTDRELSASIEDNLFEYRPSVLCAWCPLAKICPSANIINHEKMQTAYAGQPEPEELVAGIRI